MACFALGNVLCGLLYCSQQSGFQTLASFLATGNLKVTPAVLQNLPKQCYLESSRENLIWSLGIAAIASQAGNLYCALSLVLRMPLKRE